MRPLELWRELARGRVMRVWLPAGTVAVSLGLAIFSPPLRASLCEFMMTEARCDR